MTKQRHAYWDNLKCVLIFLVVLGHFLLPVANNGKTLQIAFNFIYLFHMPAFVFVSGYFAKSYVKKSEKELRLLGFLTLFVVFTISIWIVDLVFTGKFSPGSLLSTNSASWYMLAMFFWYLMIPFVSRLKPWISLPAFILLALLVGAYEECGNFLVLSRTIVFFPFFLAGYWTEIDRDIRVTPWARIACIVVLILSVVMVYYLLGLDKNYIDIIFGQKSYSVIGLSMKSGLFARTIWYAVASLLILVLMCLIPQKINCFTYIGERTIGIYILHRILRDVFVYLGLYDYLGKDWVLFLLLIPIAFLTVFITSGKNISALLNKSFKIRFFLTAAENQSYDPE